MRKLNWKRVGIVEYGAKTYHLWEFLHPGGYIACQLTRGETAPAGDGHYTNLEGLLRRFAGKSTVTRFPQPTTKKV